MLSSPEVWKEFFETYYRSEINKLAYRISEGDNTSRSIYVNFRDLTIFREGKLGEELLENPDVVMAHANAGLEMAENIYDVPLKDCVARFYNLPTSRRVLIRDLRSIHISKFVAIEGIVRKVTEVRPRVVKAVFMCRVCGKKMEVEQEDSTLKPPYECRACKSKGRFIFIPEESLSTDSQRVRIQEYPENLRGGEQPQTIDVILEGDLAGEVNPGDRVIINGIVRARPKGVGQRKLAHMDLYIEGNSVEVLQQEYEEFEITEEDKKKIIALSKDPNIYDKIVKSIAPAIYGYEDIKLAIALQLFGGVPKKLPDGTEIRGDIHILLVGDPGVAKCVDYDTEVLLSDGSLVKIGDLVEKVLMNGKKEIDDGFYAETNHDIISLDSCTLKLRTSKANIVWKRFAPEVMFKIRTKTGRTIKVTPTHPFFTIRDGKFATVKVKDLKKGDLIATPRIIPVFGKSQPIPNNFEKSKARNAVRLELSEKTSPEFWRFIALFIAEGYSQNRNGCATLYFTNNDDRLINEFFNYAKRLGLNPKLRKNKTAKEVVISSVELYNFFDLLGINGRSKEKKVPDLLFRCSREEIKAFLSAFFDAEASVDKRRPKITVTSASEKLLRQIQHLLLRFGIVSQLHETYSKATNSKTPKLRRYYRLTITGENALKFADEIGFTVKSKICSWNVKNNPNLDVIPDVSTILRETRKLLGLTQSECGVNRSTYQHLERGDRRPSRNILAKIVEAFKSKLNGNKQAEFNVRFLELLANSDIFWDEVIEIETYRPEHPFVYDLQVLKHHNFVANDIFVHNSQLLRYVHRIAPRSVYTTGKGTTTAGLCVAPDTLLFTERYGIEISKLVESTSLKKLKEGIYTSDKSITIQTINPMKIALKTSSKLWKIKSPEKLVRIKTITGKEIITTPETRILTVVDGNICWKQAKELDKGDFVATARRLEHKGRKILTIELIKDLDTVTVYGVKQLVKDLIEAIKRDRKITIRDLSKLLCVSENNLYYSWIKEDAKSNIKLSTLIKLAELTGYSLEKVAEKIEFFSQYHGHKIKLPKYLDERFLYFAGLIAGDGDITTTPHGGVTIRFSNTNPKLRNKFRQIVRELFDVEVKEDGNALKFNSKIIGHILNKLGIPNSPKSHRLDMSEILLSLPNEELSAFIRGLFDCDGTVILRNNGSSYVALETTSKKLAKKLQLALLRFGIISHLRKRDTEGQKSMIDGRIIISKHSKFELKIYGDNIKKFAKFIGFEHPEKLKKLQRLIELQKSNKTNIDVIPDVTRILREIREFYGLNAKDVYGSTTVELRSTISRSSLKRAVEIIKRNANIENIKLKVPDDLRLKIGKYVDHNKLGISRNKFYEYFVRKNRNTSIPFKVLKDVLNIVDNQKLREDIEKVLNKVLEKEKVIKAKLEYLDSLANSDILWERIKEKEVLESPYDFVYDLTVEDLHSFIANGIVVHNTATAVRDEIDGRWTLEAGALILADKGIALVDEIDKMRKEDRSALHEALEQQSYHKDTEIMLADGRKIKIGEFVDKLIEANKDKVIYGKDTEVLLVDGIYVLAYDLNARKIVPVKADRVSRHKAPEKFVKMKFGNGREITVTPEHPILVWDNGIKTIEAEKVRKSMLVPCVRFYETCVTSDVSEDLARFIGFILSEGFCYENKKNHYYEIGFTNTDEKIVEEYKNILNRLNICHGISVTIRDGCKPLITVRTISKDLYMNLKRVFPEAFPDKVERPARCKRIPAMIMSAPKDVKIAFLNAFFKEDGFVDNYRVGFSTSSRAMAEDLQDLLLMLGINSYIHEYYAESRKHYKIVITGTESIRRFSEIIKDDPRYERVLELLRRSSNKRNYRDILPKEIAEEVRWILNALHINDGSITTNLNRNYNIHRLTVKGYLDKAKNTLKKIEEDLNSGDFERMMKSALKVVTIKELSEELDIPYSTLRYRIKKYKDLMNRIIEKARKRLEEIRRKINEIENIVNGNIAFLRVKDVEIIENQDSKWVYDVTVEPYHLFVSHGLILHNTVSIAKAGINAILRARCALLAAANPKHGRFNRYEPLVEQIDLSPTLLSRFDLIFILTDEPDEMRDELLARHVLDVHELGERLELSKVNPINPSIVEAKAEKIKPAIEPELLRKYIAYAKKTVFPVLTREAKDKIVEFYKSLRAMARSDEHESIPITARQLEALIRLAEASARIRLSNEVTVEDAERAIRIFKKSLEQIAIDPETGKIDIDYAFTGTSATQRDRIAIIKRIIEELEKEHERGAPEEEILRRAEERGISREKAEEILSKLRQKGEIYSPRYGYYRVVKYD